MSLTDRQRVEMALLPNIMLHVVVAGVNDPEHDDAKEMVRLLNAAANDVVADLTERERLKLMRRTIRVHDEVMGPFEAEGMRTDKAGLILFYLLSAIVESEYFVIGAESELSRAIDLFLPAIEHAAEIDRLDASARKAARKLLRDLQARGFFCGVAMPAAA